MDCTHHQEGSISIISIKGDIDLSRSPNLRQLFQSKAHDKCPALLVDFTQVNYIDSSGLATLVEYYQTSRAYNGKIALAGLSPRVRSVFDLVRLGEILNIYNSLDEARQALS